MRRLVTRCAMILAAGATMVGAWAIRPAFDVTGRGYDLALAATTGALQLSAAAGTSAAIAGCPLAAAFSFCDQAPGSTGPTATFTLTATAAASGLTMKLAAVPGLSSSFSAGDFTIASNNCGGSLSASASCTIGVAFTPLAASKGLREAALVITDSNSSDLAALNLAGHASGLALALPAALTCPASNAPGDNAYTFCPQAIHTVSTAQTFTLTAQNTVAGVTLSFVAVPGLSSQFNGNDFTIQSTTCASMLTAGASCTASIAFTPTTTGFRTAQLTATDSTGDSTSVVLAGLPTNGLAIVPQSIQLTCSPRNFFEFCNTPLGGSSSTNSYALQNTSGVQLTGVTVPTASSVGNFKVSSNSCVPTLAAGASCTISVVFFPQSTGLLQDSLTVADSSGDTATFNLAGTGDNFTIQLASTTPTQIDVNQGGTATYGAQIIPDAVFGAEGEKIALQCPATASLPTDTSCTITPCPASVTAATTTNFSVPIVTSSRASIAAVPTGPAGCVSYGPGPAGTAATTSSARVLKPGVWRGPENFFSDGSGGGLGELGALGALAALVMALASFAIAPVANRSADSLRRTALFAGAAIVAIVAAGCHNNKTPDPSTPAGTYQFSLQGSATDANGNSFNTSRAVQLNLDVVQGAASTGGFSQ